MSLPQPPITAEQIEALPPDIRKLVLALVDYYERRIAEYEERIIKYEARIAKLEADLAAFKKTPRNSSLPPSTEHPHAKPARDKKKNSKKKKRGGQTGHPKHGRDLIPSEQCSKIVPLHPDSCRRCGTALDGQDPEPLRHQVWELPVIQPIITEYQRHRRTCSYCGETTCAPLPVGVPTVIVHSLAA